jgi:hypothetical protein
MNKKEIMIISQNIQQIINRSGSRKHILILISPTIIVKSKITKVHIRKNNITKFNLRKRLCMLQK